jgi:plasmid stabilization system protein ParE
MKVLIREGAYDDLDRIFDWIAKDRPRSAHAVIERILESTERLGRFPHAGHPAHLNGS